MLYLPRMRISVLALIQPILNADKNSYPWQDSLYKSAPCQRLAEHALGYPMYVIRREFIFVLGELYTSLMKATGDPSRFREPSQDKRR